MSILQVVSGLKLCMVLSLSEHLNVRFHMALQAQNLPNRLLQQRTHSNLVTLAQASSRLQEAVHEL